MCKQRDYFACFFKGKTRTADPTHVIRNLSGSPSIISVWCLLCNTGNPNPSDQVHITKLHTNYRHEMLITLLLVAGVIFAPQLSYFNSMSVCFTVWLIAGLSLLPCVPTLNYNHFEKKSFFFFHPLKLKFHLFPCFLCMCQSLDVTSVMQNLCQLDRGRVSV